MTRLTDLSDVAESRAAFSSAALWSLFDGDREAMNLAHECLDRHVDGDRVALRVAHADGADEVITFAELSRRSSQVAHFLTAQGIARGDRVAVMIEPSLAFYAANLK